MFHVEIYRSARIPKFKKQKSKYSIYSVDPVCQGKYLDEATILWYSAAAVLRQDTLPHPVQQSLGTVATLDLGNVTLVWSPGLRTGRVTCRGALLVYRAVLTRQL